MIRQLLDIVFPPLCLACKKRCETHFLCPDCWGLCTPPDPIERCRHCFEELEGRGDLCVQCRGKRLLPIARAYVFDSESPAHHLGLEAAEAMAGFALLQWVQLEWPIPDMIIPMPDPDSRTIASSFARFLDRPLAQALYRDGSYKEDRLEEGQKLLVFDVANPLQNLQRAAFSLSESCPKRVYLLSLFGHVDYSV